VNALALVNQEPETTAWLAPCIDPNVFGIFDAFPSEQGRDAHLNDEVAEQLMAKTAELLAKRRKFARRWADDEHVRLTRYGRRHEPSCDCGPLQGLSSSRPTRSMPSEETRMALE
jgi:hypothetical protein